MHRNDPLFASIRPAPSDFIQQLKQRPEGAVIEEDSGAEDPIRKIKRQREKGPMDRVQ